jgi:hypothetical protein
VRQRRYDVRMGLLLAVGAPLAGIGLMGGITLLYAYGPAWLDTWYGGLLNVVLTLVALGLVVFSNLYFTQVVVFLGSFLALGFAVFAASSTAEAWVLHERGQTTNCTITHIDERQETRTSTDANGNSSTTTDYYYDHRLTCDRPRITAMTTGSPAGKVGERVEVAYDPESRIGVQPADGAFDYGSSLLTCCLGAAIGIALRLFLVLRRL